MTNIPDYYTNPNYWQEYECKCGNRFDVSPIPLPDTKVECTCGRSWMAGENDPTTYIPESGNPPRVVPYPYLK